MAATAIGFTIGATAASTVVNVQQQKQAAKRQEQALASQSAYQAEYLRQQEAQAAQMQEAMNRQVAQQEKSMADSMERGVPRRASGNTMMSQAEQSAQSGASSTMLTGPTGVDPTQLALGRSTLLGS
jgi:cell division protein FtsL